MSDLTFLEALQILRAAAPANFYGVHGSQYWSPDSDAPKAPDCLQVTVIRNGHGQAESYTGPTLRQCVDNAIKATTPDL